METKLVWVYELKIPQCPTQIARVEHLEPPGVAPEETGQNRIHTLHELPETLQRSRLSNHCPPRPQILSIFLLLQPVSGSFAKSAFGKMLSTCRGIPILLGYIGRPDSSTSG